MESMSLSRTNKRNQRLATQRKHLESLQALNFNGIQDQGLPEGFYWYEEYDSTQDGFIKVRGTFKNNLYISNAKIIWNNEQKNIPMSKQM